MVEKLPLEFLDLLVLLQCLDQFDKLVHLVLNRQFADFRVGGATVAVDDQNLFQSVPGKLVAGFLKHLPDQIGAVGQNAGLVLRLMDLP